MRAHSQERFRDFRQLMTAVGGRSEEAAQEIFERFAPYVLRVIRRLLNHRLRSRYDPEDFSQEVWSAFFSLPAERMESFDNERHLSSYLASMARNKVIEKYRQMQTRKYDLGREVSFSRLSRATHLADPVSNPEQTAMTRESWEHLIHELTGRQHQALTMLRDQYTHHEIAEFLGVNPKTIQRLLREIRNLPKSA